MITDEELRELCGLFWPGSGVKVALVGGEHCGCVGVPLGVFLDDGGQPCVTVALFDMRHIVCAPVDCVSVVTG